MIGTAQVTSSSNQEMSSSFVTRRRTSAAISRTTILRFIFLASLAAAAGICGYVAYSKTCGLESEVAIQTYEGVAIMALQGAQGVFQRKVEGNEVMASILSHAFPNAIQWPFVGLPGYSTLASKVADLSVAISLGYGVLVQPEQAEQFEAHAEQFYKANGYPKSAGRSEFGFGIYSKNKSSPFSDGRYHDTSGKTSHGSNYSILCPIFQHTRNDAKNLMYNVQSDIAFELDSILECSRIPLRNSSLSPSCTVVSDFVELMLRPGPAAMVYQPIYPANDAATVVGLTGSSVHWEDALINIVPEYVEGLDCVISSKTRTYTYVIEGGKPTVKGEGDLHDPDYTMYGKSILLNDKATNASASVLYNLTVYPTSKMLSRFNTKSPLKVSLGFVGVILFCTSLFFLYDFFVQSKSRQGELILDVKRRFVRFLSHEMRTPLNTVCMGLDLLQGVLHNELDTSDTEINTRDRELLLAEAGDADSYRGKVAYWLDLTGDILENSHNTVSVLNDLLNYDKIEAGTFSIELGVVPIWSLIKKTTAEFQIHAKKRNVDLVLATEGNKGTDVESEGCELLEQLSVIGDNVKLSQVIRQMVSNALEFTPPNGTVIVTAIYFPDGLPDAAPFTGNTKSKSPAEIIVISTRAGSIRVAVIDTGDGMTPDQLKLLFAEGAEFDANKLRTGGGSGLGHCITKEIVQLHGGTVEVLSRGPGMGSTFTVELPLFEVPSAWERPNFIESIHDTKKMDRVNNSDQETTHGVNSTANHSITPQHHILVVDDVVSNSKMLVRLLERRGYTCVTAKNGQEAVDAFIANKASAESGDEVPFDTVLMDFEMPVMDGPEATRRIRALGCTAFIFGVTGNLLERDIAHFKASGADHVIPKPVGVALLEACWANLKAMDTSQQTKNSCSPFARDTC